MRARSSLTVTGWACGWPEIEWPGQERARRLLADLVDSLQSHEDHGAHFQAHQEALLWERNDAPCGYLPESRSIPTAVGSSVSRETSDKAHGFVLGAVFGISRCGQ